MAERLLAPIVEIHNTNIISLEFDIVVARAFDCSLKGGFGVNHNGRANQIT